MHALFGKDPGSHRRLPFVGARFKRMPQSASPPTGKMGKEEPVGDAAMAEEGGDGNGQDRDSVGTAKVEDVEIQLAEDGGRH